MTATVAGSGPLIEHVDEVLSTTRAVRRRLDLERPVPIDVVERCVEMARQAPIAGNVEVCRFVAIDEPNLRAGVAAVYVRAAEDYVYKRNRQTRTGAPAAAMERVLRSAKHLRDHLHEVPMLVLVGTIARPPKAGTGAVASGYYGSVYPTIWSFQLALRSRGLGSSLTCIHLHYAEDVATLLELPENFTQVALLPVAYTLGTDFRPANRPLALERVLHRNRWETSS